MKACSDRVRNWIRVRDLHKARQECQRLKLACRRMEMWAWAGWIAAATVAAAWAFC